MNEETPIGKVYDARLLRRLLRYLRPYRGWVAASLCLLLFHSVLGVSGPYLTKVAIDYSLNPEPGSTSLLDGWLPADRWNSLQIIVLIYLGVQILSFALRAAQIHVMNYTGQRVMFDLRNEIFRHLQGMGVPFFDRNPVGRLVTRVTTDVDMLNELFTSGVVAIAGDLITLVVIISVMLSLSPQLTLVLSTVAPLVLLATMWFRRRARQSYRDVRLAIAKINSFLQEHFGGIAVVQIFNHEGRSWDQFNEINAEHRDAQYDAIRAHAYFLPLVEWLGVLGLAVLLLYGGYLVSTTPMTIGVVVAFLMYGTRVFRPLQDLSDKYNILQSAMASSERIFGLLDTPADEELADRKSAAANGVLTGLANASPSAKPSQALAGTSPQVEFQNVWFAYKDEEWVLRDVSFVVAPGEMVAIVGHTGAGKTTLISLLLRFYEVQKGRILVGGRDVREWPLEDLRRQFGIVLQDPYVFSGTIESNIRLRGTNVSDERLREVIREVNLDAFVGSLSRGVDEPILERGSSLSSGQKQLLSFARALAFNPRFLILDEATSSVDTDTEFKIREALSRMLAGHTSIVIAHRLSTIQKANRIVVMHKSEVRETGNHQELLANRGIYYKLYQLQYRDQELETGSGAQDQPHAATELQDVIELQAPVESPAPGEPTVASWLEPPEADVPFTAESLAALTVEPAAPLLLPALGGDLNRAPRKPANGTEQKAAAAASSGAKPVFPAPPSKASEPSSEGQSALPDQPAAAPPATAQPTTNDTAKPSASRRRRRKKNSARPDANDQPERGASSPAASSVPDASAPAQLSLSLEDSRPGANSEAPQNGPAASPDTTTSGAATNRPKQGRGKGSRRSRKNRK